MSNHIYVGWSLALPDIGVSLCPRDDFCDVLALLFSVDRNIELRNFTPCLCKGEPRYQCVAEDYRFSTSKQQKIYVPDRPFYPGQRDAYRLRKTDRLNSLSVVRFRVLGSQLLINWCIHNRLIDSIYNQQLIVIVHTTIGQ